MDQLLKAISNLGSLECGLLVRRQNKNLDKFTWVFSVPCNIFIFLVNLSKQVFKKKKKNVYLPILIDQIETTHDNYVLQDIRYWMVDILNMDYSNWLDKSKWLKQILFRKGELINNLNWSFSLENFLTHVYKRQVSHRFGK